MKTGCRLFVWVAVLWAWQTTSFANGQQTNLPEQLSWDIDLDFPVYPLLNFDDENLESEITFQYSYTGTYQPGTKYFETTLLAEGCLDGPATSLPESLEIKGETVNPDTQKFSFDVDVIQQLIVDSSYWNSLTTTTAEIKFCVRVDYLNNVESVNFFEADVTVKLDLSVGFTPIALILARSNASLLDELDADADYGVVAYYCNAATGERTSLNPQYKQGDTMEICVRVDDTLEGAMHIESILDFTIFQLENGSGPAAIPTTAIVDAEPDALTTYSCMANGRCFIVHQLTSKWFDDEIPGTLEVRGTALLGLGVKVPVRSLLEITDKGAVSEFALEAELLGEAGVTAKQSQKSTGLEQESDSSTSEFDTTLVVGVGAAAIGLIVGALGFYIFRGRSSGKISQTGSTIPDDIHVKSDNKEEQSTNGDHAPNIADPKSPIPSSPRKETHHVHHKHHRLKHNEEQGAEWEYGQHFRPTVSSARDNSGKHQNNDFALHFEAEKGQNVEVVFEKNLLGGHAPRHVVPPTEVNVDDDEESSYDFNWVGGDDYEEDLVTDGIEEPEEKKRPSLNRLTSDLSVSSRSVGSAQSFASQRSFLEVDPGSAQGDFETLAHSSSRGLLSDEDGDASIASYGQHSLGTLNLSVASMSCASLESLDMSTHCLYLGSDNAV